MKYFKKEISITETMYEKMKEIEERLSEGLRKPNLNNFIREAIQEKIKKESKGE